MEELRMVLSVLVVLLLFSLPITIPIGIIIWIRRRKKKRKMEEVSILEKWCASVNSEYLVEIVGMFYQFGDDSTHQGSFEGWAVAQKDNKHDENAVAIFNDKNVLVGYLPSYKSQEYHEVLVSNYGGRKSIRGCTEYNWKLGRWHGFIEIDLATKI